MRRILFASSLVWMAAASAPYSANAEAVISRFSGPTCIGAWNAQWVSSVYRGEDRRNNYWLRIRISGMGSDEFAGPWTEHSHCEPVGIPNNFFFHVRGCNNDDLFFCEDQKNTIEIRVPRITCSIPNER